jgi:hypothetical protein
MQYQGCQTSLPRVPSDRSAALGDIRLSLGRNPSSSLWLGWQVRSGVCFFALITTLQFRSKCFLSADHI